MTEELADTAVAVIAVATIVAILIRPFRTTEGIWALAGGLAMIGIGQVSLKAAATAVIDLAPVLAFLAGIFWLTLVARRARVFDHAARLTVRAANNDGRLLLAMVFALGTVTTAIFSNDAAVVIITPLILQICRALRIYQLPYAFACTFVADTASSLLPVSNPINLLYADQLGLSFQDHVIFLALPTLAAIVVNVAAFFLVFHDRIPRRFDSAELVNDPLTDMGKSDHLIVWGIALVASGYIVAAFTGLAPYWVTLAGGSSLALYAWFSGRVHPGELLRAQPISLYAFVVGLALIVVAVDRAGLLATLGNAVNRASESATLADLVTVTFGTALGTNLINNWTMALAMIPPLKQAGTGDLLVFGSMLGADIGPNLSVVGSLATVIWLTEVRQDGLTISGWMYLKLGIIVTVPALTAAVAVLFVIGWIMM